MLVNIHGHLFVFSIRNNMVAFVCEESSSGIDIKAIRKEKQSGSLYVVVVRIDCPRVFRSIHRI